MPGPRHRAFLDGEVLDRETWWGIADDTAETHTE